MTASAAIRRAVPEDESPILDLWTQLSAYYASLEAVLPKRWQGPPSPTRRAELLARLWRDPERSAGFVAESNGRIVGFCRAELSDEGSIPATIHTLVVQKEHRGHGLGTALMEAAMGWCAVHGATEVGLDVLPANVDAAAFHESLGFSPYLVSYLKRLEPPI